MSVAVDMTAFNPYGQYTPDYHFEVGGPSSSSEEQPRKRPRSTLPAVTNTQEDGKEMEKRARGRPRLDTTDQTVADRRRTQIRLAQRAYRSRRESAIQELAQRNTNLHNTTQEMTEAIRQFQDLAANNDIQAIAPALAQQLRATTEKLLGLAARTASDVPQSTSQSERGSGSPPNVGGPAGRHGDSPPTNMTRQAANDNLELSTSASRHGRRDSRTVSKHPIAGNTWHGQATTWPIMPGPVASASMPAAPVTSQAYDYEIITHPTPENASFVYNFQSTPLANPFAYPQPPMTQPLSLLSLPDTYAYRETTFGRRLYRYTMELGYRLISMPYPPASKFNQVFGFQIKFETKDLIKARIQRILARTTNQSLNYWQVPIWHAGGNGQHFDMNPDYFSTSAQPAGGYPYKMGNQDTVNLFRAPGGDSAVHAMGPFTQQTADAILESMEDDQSSMRIPGLQGEFFDPTEVELYMLTRGVMIPPQNETVSAAIDPTAFSNSMMLAPSTTHDMPSQPIARHSPSEYSTTTAHAQPTTSMSFADIGQSSQPIDKLDPRYAAPFSINSASAHHTSTMNTLSPAAKQILSMAPAVPQDVPTDPNTPISNPTIPYTLPHSGSSFYNASFNSPASKRMITLDVGTFIAELAKRSTCLGRAPGVRAQDINEAFWASSKDVSVEAY